MDVDQARHNEQTAVVENAVVNSNGGSIGGIADERYAAVVTDGDCGVVPDKAGVASEERATADVSGHSVSSGLRLSGQVPGFADVIVVRENGDTHWCQCQLSVPRRRRGAYSVHGDADRKGGFDHCAVLQGVRGPGLRLRIPNGRFFVTEGAWV
jgi:hypothetical protein